MSSKLMSMKFMQRAQGSTGSDTAESASAKHIQNDEHWTLPGVNVITQKKQSKNIEYESGYSSFLAIDRPNYSGRASFGLFNKALEPARADAEGSDVKKGSDEDSEDDETTERERRKREGKSGKKHGETRSVTNSPASTRGSGKKRKSSELTHDVISLDSSQSKKVHKNKHKKKRK
ncbi:M-phase phosphoprotein 6 family protein [Schizosaccharomyces japonicus yFS275]|uniref:M-phase phosphoprotein 6 family protein n=1 Tax=Schizosaccharomyces japonicus (strain yFS275 / FY16936) TaxID=402676 RepID=B6JXW9_SCHJY|nr:M-phase phosphoprotein 6 family protein [Schizosaccharomyces japonicus yFS275]EEB06387.1 M-phase phosphoprotein 6 family protein [Schizosaccharomyces japonicus yFS275]